MNKPGSIRKCGFGSLAFASIVRLLIFGILAVAVIGKIQNAPAILKGDSLLSSWLILKLVIAVEIFVAACILLATRTTVWIAVVSLFSTFTVFATYEMLLGGGCECFGRSLPSWVSLPVDLVVLGVMVGSRRIWRQDVVPFRTEAARPSIQPLKRLSRRDAIALITGAGAALFVWGMTFPSSRAGRESEVQPNLKFLLAQDWIGAAWPINENMNERLSALSNGEWLVLILRADCEHCVALAQELTEGRASEAEHNARIATFVAGSDSWAVHLEDVSMETSGSIQVKWPRGTEPFIASPAAFLLDAGTIQDARDGKECRAFVLKVLGMASNSGHVL